MNKREAQCSVQPEKWSLIQMIYIDSLQEVVSGEFVHVDEFVSPPHVDTMCDGQSAAGRVGHMSADPTETVWI